MNDREFKAALARIDSIHARIRRGLKTSCPPCRAIVAKRQSARLLRKSAGEPGQGQREEATIANARFAVGRLV